MRLHTICLIAFLAAPLISCSSSSPGDLYDVSSASLNPTPHHDLVVTGHVDGGVSVPELIARYSTAAPYQRALQSPQCEAWINHIEGVAGPKNVEIHIAVTQSGDDVTAVVPVDRFTPGACNWVLSQVSVVVRGRSGQSTQYGIADGTAYERARFLGSNETNKTDHKVVFYCTQKDRFFCSPHIGGYDGIGVLVTDDLQDMTFEEHTQD